MQPVSFTWCLVSFCTTALHVGALFWKTAEGVCKVRLCVPLVDLSEAEGHCGQIGTSECTNEAQQTVEWDSINNSCFIKQCIKN